MSPDVSIDVVIPVRNRRDELARTLDALSRSRRDAGVIVIDNASDPPVRAPDALPNGWPVTLIRLVRNEAAASRTVAARASSADWLLMLDDDSAPADDGWARCAAEAPCDVAAIGGDVRLPDGAAEAGGLPEVFVGCAALVRRGAYLEAGGYDASFGYYGEETDLCARLIRNARRIAYDPRFRVVHRRSETGRDVAAIVERLACNETLTVHRYAPDAVRAEWIERTLARRRVVAEREGCLDAFRRGVERFERSAAGRRATPLTENEWDRLTGRAFVRTVLEDVTPGECEIAMPAGPPGKHAEVIAEEARRAGWGVRESSGLAIAGTLAPCKAVEAAERFRADGRSALAISPLALDVTTKPDALNPGGGVGTRARGGGGRGSA